MEVARLTPDLVVVLMAAAVAMDLQTVLLMMLVWVALRLAL